MKLHDLLIYYGYPSLINGSQSQEEAIGHFARYSLVVLGDGLQNATHPDHPFTRRLAAELSECQLFGYIDLGVHSPHGAVQNLDLAEIEQRARAWRGLGAHGVLLDDYGYDFAVTRERQRAAVEICHSNELSVIANAWDPRHALSPDPGLSNPRGLAANLKPTDFYLWESYLVSESRWTSFKTWRAKANTLTKVLKRCPVGVLSCTTTAVHGLIQGEGDEWPFVWGSAWVEGHHACGWGEPNFSASDNQAPFRARPAAPAERRRGNLRAAGPEAIECGCEHGRVVSDFKTKELRVEPRPSVFRRLFRWRSNA